MMVTDLRCWWQNHYVGDFFRYVCDFLNVLNRSPTHLVFNIRHQHRCNRWGLVFSDFNNRLLVFTELGYHDQVEYLMSNNQKEKKIRRAKQGKYDSRIMKQQQQEGTFIEYSNR